MVHLNVFFENERVGIVISEGDGQVRFSYEKSWLANTSAFPISISLPLLADIFPKDKASSFFANLLPEANVRRRVCKKLGISEGNDFELLKAIGGDCSGALTLTVDDEPPRAMNSYELIDDDQLANWSIGAPDAFSEVAGKKDIRLSLAGAQDKLPVKMVGDKFYLPKGNSPSTHILKFASSDYSHLPENETFTTMLAKAVDVPVVNIGLHQSTKERIAVVERYDRRQTDGTYSRLHQEDFCQALGINPNTKYEKEGGPSFRDCSDLIKQHCTVPAVELEKLIRWAIFNLLVHNADAHGKNISVLFSRGETELAPFYDLVCTRNYENLDRDMAMAYSGRRDPAEVHKNHLEGFAKELEVSAMFVNSIMLETQEKLASVIPQTVAEFRERYGESPVLEHLPQIITKRIRKTKQSFA